jgi:hypothetical protein
MKPSNKKLLHSFNTYYCPNSEKNIPIFNHPHPKTTLIKSVFESKFDYAWYAGYECPYCRWQFFKEEVEDN